jgi:hypothetical protein
MANTPHQTATLKKTARTAKPTSGMKNHRFAGRIDVEAAWERGICTVDATNGSSYPVLGMGLGADYDFSAQ